MTRAVRTPGGLKALKAQEGFGAMLAARVGGARVRRFMIVGIPGTNRPRASLNRTDRHTPVEQRGGPKRAHKERQRHLGLEVNRKPGPATVHRGDLCGCEQP
jgi:hypothetical protein